MHSIPVTARPGVPSERTERLAPELHALRTLADVLAWARAQTPPRAIAEIVTQDEYTHDVVLADAERGYLVFDTT